MNPHNQTMELINNLTSNEDMRQDLWVIYLSDKSTDLVDSLKRLYDENRLDNKVQRELWRIAMTQPTEYLVTFLNNFSDFEQSFMILLMLGQSLEDIAQQRDMSILRVQQVLTAIRNSNAWEQFQTGERC